MRAKEDRRASHMMALVLAFKFAKPGEDERPPSNVVDLHGYSRRVGASG
jgi:hypothetical protein